jgi:hypothetical protein
VKFAVIARRSPKGELHRYCIKPNTAVARDAMKYRIIGFKLVAQMADNLI